MVCGSKCNPRPTKEEREAGRSVKDRRVIGGTIAIKDSRLD